MRNIIKRRGCGVGSEAPLSPFVALAAFQMRGSSGKET
jgi:hypothetical protein